MFYISYTGLKHSETLLKAHEQGFFKWKNLTLELEFRPPSSSICDFLTKQNNKKQQKNKPNKQKPHQQHTNQPPNRSGN